MLRNIVLASVLITATSSAVPAIAQSQAVAAPAKSLSADSPIDQIAASPAGKAVLDKNLPTLLTHPAYEQFKGMTLRQVQPLANGEMTEAMLVAVDADLKKIKPEQ